MVVVGGASGCPLIQIWCSFSSLKNMMAILMSSVCTGFVFSLYSDTCHNSGNVSCFVPDFSQSRVKCHFKAAEG